MCGCALRHNCERFALGCSNFETLIQGVLETLDESNRFGQVLNGGVEWNINLLQKAFTDKDRTLCTKMLAENIVMRCFDYHHAGAYHLGGNKKSGYVSQLSNEQDRNFEAKKCVVKFKACHHWDHTIHEKRNYCTPTRRDQYEVIKGKEDLFVSQGSVCKGVGFHDSSHRKCLLGLDDPKTVATLLDLIENTVYNNPENSHIDKNAYNRRNIFLRMFECNHIHKTDKEYAWEEEEVNQIRKKMKENGEVVCFVCHAFITKVLCHER